ncbi:hypothetical protein TNCV_404931 [Trichonephila clavipes]|nr:hypothetical protein TNCV_404931 [Trichonephila clavipes]
MVMDSWLAYYEFMPSATENPACGGADSCLVYGGTKSCRGDVWKFRERENQLRCRSCHFVAVLQSLVNLDALNQKIF